jgi:hypothetical protein
MAVLQSAFEPPKIPKDVRNCIAGKKTKWVTKNSALM